ncbi:MAG: hypothetical protein QNJ00_02740 [Woeseiaceae bacterium]|nr:hypothetical protein [Woeseiaceae bacterium]
MGVFEYIGVLVSVIMGLGITHLAVGASKLIQNRATTKACVPHALWTFNILLYILVIWWSMFWWSGLEDWTAFHYLGITLYAIVLFLLSAMLYPYDMPSDIDIEAYFFRNRRWFFSLMIAAWLLDIPETLGKEIEGLRPVPPQYYVFVSSMIVLAIVGMLTSNRRVHTALPLAWLMLLGSFLSMSVVSVIDSP